MTREEPFFQVRREGDRWVTAGAASCRLGLPVGPSDTVAGPGGVWLSWSWDGVRFTLRNSRDGFFPAYYWATERGFAISTSIPLLVERGAPTDLDDVAVAVFLRLDSFIGDATPFRAIRAVPPCSAFEWQDGRLRVETGWPVPKTSALDRDSAVDAYIALFRQAMQRRDPGDAVFAVPLSGGRDSRHILLELVRMGRRPTLCVTTDIPPARPDDDTHVALRLAERLGVPCTVLPQPASRLAADLKTFFRVNFCAEEHAWYGPVAGHLSGRADLVYDGLAGDTLSESALEKREHCQLYAEGRLRELCDALMPAGREYVIRRVLPVAVYRRFSRDIAVASLIRELDRHAEAADPIGSFVFMNRCRRVTALLPFRVLSSSLRVHTPYLDRDLCDFLRSLPASMLWDHDFHTDTIRRAYPEVAGIPYARSRYKQSASAAHLRRLTWELAELAARNRPLELVSTSFLFSRLGRCVALPRCRRTLEWYGPLIVYLVQLQRFCEGRPLCLSAAARAGLAGAPDGQAFLEWGRRKP